MNRRDINRVLNVLPFSSKVIGSPRRSMKMFEYASENPKVYFKQITTEDEPEYNIPDFFKPKNLKYPVDFFLSIIKNGRVWGRNGAVIGAGDIFIQDVSREFNEGKGVAHSIFYTLKQAEPKHLSGKAAVIGTAGSNVYYHWMLDVLPRLAIIAEETDLAEVDYFITEFNDHPFQRETLSKLGIPISKIVASNDNWKFHIKTETLFVPSLVGPIGQPTLFQINFLRELYKDKIYGGKGFRRIYISRRKTGTRVLVNEDEVVMLLKQLNFEILDCESLSVVEQVKAFSQAAVIIGSHGSAFTNLLFCNEGTKVLEIFNTTHTNPCFFIICGFRNLNHFFMSGESVPFSENPKSDNTRITVNELKQQLEKMALNE